MSDQHRKFKTLLRQHFLDQQRQTECWYIDVMLTAEEQAQIRKENLKKGVWTMRNLTTIKIENMSNHHIESVLKYFGEIPEVYREWLRRSQE